MPPRRKKGYVYPEGKRWQGLKGALIATVAGWAVGLIAWWIVETVLK